jgi:PIN domain nuclease of toxin-antitoxin system
VIVCDTHVLLFDAFAPRRLSKPARRALDRGEADGELACADISLWEMACLFASGRMRIDGDQQEAIRYVVAARAIRVLPITPDIAVRTTGLLSDSDPADRLIAATALVHRATLVSADEALQALPGLQVVW